MNDQWYVDALTTWPEVLDRQATIQHDKACLIFKDRVLSYGGFHRNVVNFAAGLLTFGVKKGDVVAIWMPNSLEWVVCQFAAYKIGALVLPIYSYYKAQELEYALRNSGATVLITSDRFLDRIDAAEILSDILPELLSGDRRNFFSQAFPSLRTIIAIECERELPSRYTYAEVAELGQRRKSDLELIARQLTISPFDPMNIMYTSGTTGFPKGGVSMHVTNLATTIQWSKLAQISPSDVILCHVPLFTNFGALYGAALGILNGCKIVVTEKFDALESLRLIEQHQVTYVPGTPSMFRMLVDEIGASGRDISSVRGGHVAGAPLTDDLMTDILQVLGAKEIQQAWGLSECGGIATVSTKHDPLDKRLRSVGKPIASAVVRIVDPETLEDLRPGAAGEIWLGDRHPGSCVGLGYFGMSDKTTAAITADGWFRTGDIGYFDDDGYLYLNGRIDDMFTVGGFNVYPAEIENQLCKIEGVGEAFVVPVPDDRLGSVPVAWLLRQEGVQPTAAAVIQHCQRIMTPQKAPRRIFFYEPGELPMTPAGKVRKKELGARTNSLVESDPTAGLP